MPRQYLSNMNIKRIIKEEMDEFDWIRETNINPWFDYNYILIDVTPTEENIELLINLALGSGLISKTSQESWSKDLDDDINQIINYFYEYDKSYLRISDEGNLMYGYYLEHSDTWTKYSKIFQENINESEEEKDPFNWISEIPAGIELQPDTLYYFEPKLTWNELPNFANRITNSEFIKGWLFRRLTGRFTNEQEGIKYFVTSNTVNNIEGWCTESDPYDDWAGIIYRGKDYVNARETFYL
jgi:hypothetical protein